MKQCEFEEILRSKGYHVIPDALFSVNIAIAPGKIYLYSFLSELHQIEEDTISNKVYGLCIIRKTIDTIIKSTLEDMELPIEIDIIIDKISVFDKLYIENNNCVCIDLCDDKLKIHDYFPQVVLSTDEDCEDEDIYNDEYIYNKEAFDACIGYVNNLITYAKLDENLKGYFVKKVHTSKYSPLAIARISSLRGFSSPREMSDEVKKYIKGQDTVVESVAVPFFLHLESMRNEQTCAIKTSFIIAGGTGTGKSEILRRYAEICDAPIVRINTADCNPTSWRGSHIADHISYYIDGQESIKKLKYAVLVFNEFDKITHYNVKRVGVSGTDWELDMQREFLRFYDRGYELMIEKLSDTRIDKYHLPTENMLLCYDGAFSGIENIIRKRLNVNSRIGYDTSCAQEKTNYFSELSMKDLEQWGYLPELLGRIGSCFTMNPMTKDLVYQILTTSSDNILDAHKTQCERLGIDLEFTDDVLYYIAEETIKSEYGFRTVKPILSHMLNGVYFNCDKYRGQKLVVDMDFVSNVK